MGGSGIERDRSQADVIAIRAGHVKESSLMTLKLCVSPEAPVAAPETIALQKKGSATGLRLGFLDNSKSNADHLLQFLLDAAQDKLPVERVIKRRKPAASRPADAAVVEDLAREADFVLSAMAD
jgi:hypothetical protein